MKNNDQRNLTTDLLRDEVIGLRGELSNTPITITADSLARMLYDCWLRGRIDQLQDLDAGKMTEEKFDLSLERNGYDMTTFGRYYQIAHRYWERHNEITLQHVGF